MGKTLFQVYDSFSVAQDARTALLASGFAQTDVDLSSREDEAGPVQGNFIMDSKDATGKRTGGLLGGTVANRNTEEEINRRVGQQPLAVPVQRGTYLLTVETDDDDQDRVALDILNRFRKRDTAESLTGRKN